MDSRQPVRDYKLYRVYMSVMLTLAVLLLAVILALMVYGGLRVKSAANDFSKKADNFNTQAKDINNNLQKLNKQLQQTSGAEIPSSYSNQLNQ